MGCFLVCAQAARAHPFVRRQKDAKTPLWVHTKHTGRFCHATGRASGGIRYSATTHPVPLCTPPHARNKNRAVTPNLLQRRKSTGFPRVTDPWAVATHSSAPSGRYSEDVLAQRSAIHNARQRINGSRAPQVEGMGIQGETRSEGFPLAIFAPFLAKERVGLRGLSAKKENIIKCKWTAKPSTPSSASLCSAPSPEGEGFRLTQIKQYASP